MLPAKFREKFGENLLIWRKISKTPAKFAIFFGKFDENFEIRDSMRTVQRSALCRSRRELSN